jgi:hypothetical protein
VNGKANNQKLENQWARLYRKIRKTELNTVVLSSEFFSRDIAEIKEWHIHLDELTKEGHELKFILYLRRPDQRFESLFIEAVKGGNHHESIRDFPYDRFINGWEICQSIIERFGPESLLVKKFELEVKGGLVKNFLASVGLENHEVNESLYQANQKPMLDQLRAINYAGELFSSLTKPYFKTARQRRKAIKRWSSWFCDETAHWNDQRKYSLLPQDISKKILADQLEENKKVAEAFFEGEMTYFDSDTTSEFDPPSLSLNEMKPEHLHEMLKHLTYIEPIIQSIPDLKTTSKHDLEID